MHYVKGGLHGRIFMKINTIFEHMLYQHYFFVYTEREFSFLLLSYSCQGELIQISLIYLHKNIKTKENCFKNFNNETVILNKKKLISNVCKKL